MNKSAVTDLDVPAGQAVYREGDTGQLMYIVESGRIDLVSAARGNAPVATLGSGEFFGEMELFEDFPRCFSAIAREPSRLLCIERAEMADLLNTNSAIAMRLLSCMAARLRDNEMRLNAALSSGARAPSVVAPVPVLAESSLLQTATSIAIPGTAAFAPAIAFPAAGSTASALRLPNGVQFGLEAGRSEFLVGRPDPAAGIVPEIDLSGMDPTRSLSRRHARLVVRDTKYYVREDASTVNGTFVNGVRVQTGVEVPIAPGDKLRFGAVEVDFVAA